MSSIPPVLNFRIFEDVSLLSEPPFLALISRRETRGTDGRISKPPRLYVVHYSAEYDETNLLPVDWRVAGALAPDAMCRLGDKLYELRNAPKDEMTKRGEFPQS